MMTRREFIELAAAGIGMAIVGECKLFDFAYQMGAESATEPESEDDEEEPRAPHPNSKGEGLF